MIPSPCIHAFPFPTNHRLLAPNGKQQVGFTSASCPDPVITTHTHQSHKIFIIIFDSACICIVFVVDTIHAHMYIWHYAPSPLNSRKKMCNRIRDERYPTKSYMMAPLLMIMIARSRLSRITMDVYYRTSVLVVIFFVGRKSKDIYLYPTQLGAFAEEGRVVIILMSLCGKRGKIHKHPHKL